MAEKLTPQQKQAVEFRGGRLLVSAAAGSGKTKVLVDRLLGYLTDPVQPANLDDFLIITYTKAAAAELRGKIASKLTERIAADPENRHLQRQMQRLYLAKISTVHSFCGDLLREYAYQMDLAPDFRVGDENECRELREQAMQEVLEQAYQHTREDPDFCTFVDTQGLGRDDRKVPEIVEKVYNSAKCHMDSEKWLEACLENSQPDEMEDASETVWGRYLLERMKHVCSLQIESMEACAALAAETPEWDKAAANLSDTVNQLKALRDCETWDQVAQHSSIDYGRLTFRKGGDEETKERIKAVRDACKDCMAKELKVFTDDSAQIMADMEQAAAATRGIVALVRKFSKAYDARKRSRRVLDFSDLEHRTLDLLLGQSRSGPTKISREIGNRFREVMVDEYQDSNAVQDAIFSTLTQQRGNCFMVGDVKQSIYQFRLADPGIFLSKYASFQKAGEPGEAEGRKVILSRNFRSGGAVLAAVNDVFRRCMSPAVGGLAYGEDEALHEGVPHIPLGEPEVELHVLDVQEKTYDEEPAFVAKRIRELLDGAHMVREGEGLRPIRPDDIVILLRSPGSVGRHFVRALEKVGVRCTSGGGQDLLQTAEIMTLRSLLQIISNPRQDIPLVAALASPLFGFTADDLARIRSQDKAACLYDALLENTDEKAVQFCTALARLREHAGLDTLAQLLERIFSVTHMDSLYAAMPEGEQRAENLQTFYHLAVEFEAGMRRDLRQFLEHLEAMEEKGLMTADKAGSPGCVTLMSIHKSKGLEFPVVFLSGLARKFNTEDSKNPVLCDKELGLGLSVVDAEQRLRYPTLARRAITARTLEQNLSEELRVLYVAMTRPKDRLIMTYAAEHAEDKLKKLALRMDDTAPELLSREVSCPGEWVLQTALRRTEAGALFAVAGKPAETSVSDFPWQICLSQPEQAEAAHVEEPPKRSIAPETLDRLRTGLGFTYPHPAATQTPSKQTATQRKGRDKDEEVAENAAAPIHRAWRKPAFLEPVRQGTAYGKIIHSVMQYIRPKKCTDCESIAGEIERLTQQGLLTCEEAALINCRKLLTFFRTPFGRKMQQGGQVLREFKFSLLDDGPRYGEGLEGERVLLQGVVDCALVEEDGITVLDFKTDFCTADTLPMLVQRYRPQVEAYAEALARIFGKPVRESCLYFFHLDQMVTL